MARRDVRDAVHGFVSVEGKVAKLLDTQPMQRLRRISQLAMASLVYPGARHSRFEHSLGVYHVACLLWERLKGNTEQVNGDALRYAALLHDTGHGPFSHVSEGPLERYADVEAVKRKHGEGPIHEAVTRHQIKVDPELRHLVCGEDAELVLSLLNGEHPIAWLCEVISGPLDADKQDYLLRDSKSCGVEYGVYDLHQLQRSLARTGGNEDRLMVKRSGVHAVEQFVLAKYYLTTQVYRHRVRLITDQMLERAICLAVDDDGIEAIQEAFHYDGTDDALRRYLAWDDDRLLVTLTSEQYDGKACHSMLQRLRSRRLLKQVFSASLSVATEGEECPILEAASRDALLGLEHSTARELERELAEAISKATETQVDSQHVIIHSYRISSVRARAGDEKGLVLVEGEPRRSPTTLDNQSTLFRSIGEQLEDAYVEVYAPVEWESEERRDRVVGALREPIAAILGEAQSTESEPISAADTEEEGGSTS